LLSLNEKYAAAPDGDLAELLFSFVERHPETFGVLSGAQSP
jgi:hypothetical protein